MPRLAPVISATLPLWSEFTVDRRGEMVKVARPGERERKWEARHTWIDCGSQALSQPGGLNRRGMHCFPFPPVSAGCSGQP